MMSVRRSSRLQEARLKLKSTKNENEPLQTTGDGSSSASTSHDNQPPIARVKRRRMEGLKSDDLQNTVLPTETTVGGGGNLSELPSMPLDILFEIFGNLTPLDLLHLIWTTKSLRSTLMQRHATSVWKSARATVGMPECPPDLSEPQFAFLGYVPECHFCFVPESNTMWSIRVRCCYDCQKKNILKHARLTHFLPKEAAEDVHRRDPLIGDVNHYDYLPCVYEQRSNNFNRLYLKSEALQLGREIMALRGDGPRLQAFYDQRRCDVQAKMRHADRCLQWQIACAEALEATYRRRKDFVTQKLQELGWALEIQRRENCDPRFLLSNPLVAKDDDLTEDKWTEIKDEMVQYMEQIKEKRLSEERVVRRSQRQRILMNQIQRYLSSRPRDEVVPSYADICQMDEFEAILDAPADVSVTAESFAEPIARLPELSGPWLQSIFQRLLTLQPNFARGIDGLSRLDLASTFFTCCMPECGEMLTYPRILTHHCMTKLFFAFLDSPKKEINKCFIALGCEPWNYGDTSRMLYHIGAKTVANLLVQMCRLDGTVTTPQEMDNLDPRFTCERCISPGDLLIFSWRAAVCHAVRSMHFEWRRFTEDTTTIIKRQETDLRREIAGKSESLDWCCTRCRQRMAFKSLACHAKQKHAVRKLREVDYYRHVDASCEFPFPLVLHHVTGKVTFDPSKANSST